MATEICRKTNGFSYLSAFIISHISTKHIWRPLQSLGYTKRRLLIPFPCSSCNSSSFINCTAADAGTFSSGSYIARHGLRNPDVECCPLSALAHVKRGARPAHGSGLTEWRCMMSDVESEERLGTNPESKRGTRRASARFSLWLIFCKSNAQSCSLSSCWKI